MTNERTSVLVVEDEPLSRDMLLRRLVSRGFEATGASTVDEAMSLLAERHFELILLDNAMHGQSGVDMLRRVRRTWSHDSLPVIMVSAMVDSDDVVEALNAGANDYVVKPINYKVLLARMQTALRMRQNVSLLVEAERQRVLMESLARTAGRIARPLGEMVDRLERLMAHPPGDAEVLMRELGGVLERTEEAVEVIDQMRTVGTMRDVPYTARLSLLSEGDEGGG